jgi:thioredoxin reductase (NADPH)
METSPQRFDAIVVGGGPAGLVGAVYLARFRRSVLVIDAGESRVAKIPRSHNYPGFPQGIPGAQLLADLRSQVARYDVRTEAARVDSLECHGDLFEVAWTSGRAQARTVLLSTGASDIEPAMPYVAEAVRDGALRYCPVCDGYEVIEQAVGVIADGAAGVREALYLRHFTSRLTLFMEHGSRRLGAEDRQRLAEAGIALVDDPIRSLRLWNQRVTVCHGDEETMCDSVYGALGMRVHSDLAIRVGARTDDDGYLQTDSHQCTTVPRLFAAGDVASGLNQISVAVGTAAIAASAMHRALGQR